jgi:hypothetical protein
MGPTVVRAQPIHGVLTTRFWTPETVAGLAFRNTPFSYTLLKLARSLSLLRLLARSLNKKTKPLATRITYKLRPSSLTARS